jgi:D-alanyl-D-alanine carboxypeptidase (penicillin-binding protein 5/6)
MKGLSAWLGILLLWTQTIKAEVSFIPAPPEIAAKAHILMEASSKMVLANKEADTRLPPASLTKIMTSYVIASELAKGKLKEDTPVFISINAWRTGGSKMFVRENTYVPLADLIHGIVIQSGNDASIAAAEHIAGSEDAFAGLMNLHAKELGMVNSHFMNVTGLPHPEHYTSAHDLALLGAALIERFPEHYKIYKQQSFTFNNITQPNRNMLLYQDPTVDGMKTGHTEEAGYCLVASALRDNMRLISVVMGSNSMQIRAAETQKLLNYGFRFYEAANVLTAHQSLASVQIWKGLQDQVSLGAGEALSVVLPRDRSSQFVKTVTLNNPIKAPLAVGDEVGKIVVSLDNKVIGERPVVALQAIESGSIFKRIWHTLLLWMMSLFDSSASEPTVMVLGSDSAAIGPASNE